MSDGISLKDLQAILAAQAEQNAQANAQMLKDVIAEMKKPNVIEQKQLDDLAAKVRSDNENRKSLSGSVKAMIMGKRATQQICSHKHPDGNTHCVYIQEARGSGYILCQKNQCILRPGVAPANYGGNDIYDTKLFNDTLQTLQASQGDIVS